MRVRKKHFMELGTETRGTGKYEHDVGGYYKGEQGQEEMM